MKNQNGICKVAIIENGEIVGWRETPAWVPAPMLPEEWAKTEEGKAAYLTKIEDIQKRDPYFNFYDDDWYLQPRWSARSRQFFWSLKQL